MNFKEVEEKYLDKLLKDLDESDQYGINYFERLVKKANTILNVTKQKLKYADITLQNEKVKLQSKNSHNKVDDLLG